MAVDLEKESVLADYAEVVGHIESRLSQLSGSCILVADRLVVTDGVIVPHPRGDEPDISGSDVAFVTFANQDPPAPTSFIRRQTVHGGAEIVLLELAAPREAAPLLLSHDQIGDSTRFASLDRTRSDKTIPVYGSLLRPESAGNLRFEIVHPDHEQLDELGAPRGAPLLDIEDGTVLGMFATARSPDGPRLVVAPASDIQTLIEGGLGNSLDLNREAPDSALRLHFHEYALAIARVLRDARGEFCMALLGRWGAGKTRLARLVQGYMADPDSFRNALLQGSLPQAPETDALRYDVLWFSAWQYRRVPEAWIYLYETFARALVARETALPLRPARKTALPLRPARKTALPLRPARKTACTKTPLPLRMARVLRVNVARRGESDLVFRLCALAAVLAPLQLFGGIAHLLIPLIGFVGFYQALAMMRRGPRAVRQIAADYAAVARHGEKLGLQAAIGADLRALLRGWIMRPTPPRDGTSSDSAPLRPRLAWWIIPAAIAPLWGIGLVFRLPIPLPEWLSEPAVGTDPVAGGRFILGWAVLALWMLLAGLTAALLVWPKDPTSRILLIVEDLDRCLPAESIEILEALKLLLEDPAMAERVQMLVLVDEEPLGVAIREKFRALMKARGLQAAAGMVREHMEKLFLCTLRLPELREGEAEELITTYTTEPSEAVDPDAAPDTAPPDTLRQSATVDEQTVDRLPGPRRVEDAPPQAVPAPSIRGELFTATERRMLRQAILSATETHGARPTPREIRGFLAKYQLARALCGGHAASEPDAVQRLADGLARAVFQNAPREVLTDAKAHRFAVEQVIAGVA
jgi:hypothetical protein